jgi:hypothetical protein
MSTKTTAKRILGELPFTAETYWYLRQAGKPIHTGYSLKKLQDGLPDWTAQATRVAREAPRGKKILIFGTLHYWISHAALVGITLGGLGHRVTLAFLPYNQWQSPINRFDLRRQNLYTLNVLKKATPLIKPISFLDSGRSVLEFPKSLHQAVEELSVRDTQYTLQVEEIALDSDLYRMRYERNIATAQVALAWMKTNRPEVVVVPNGSIQEFGSVYLVARYLDIPVVTYEFGEQRQRLWLAQNAEVMHQHTDDLWAARGGRALSVAELEQVQSLFSTRRKASLWENFDRRWQGIASVGGDAVREALGLDKRPVVLLATNVIGDSLTLGRQVFSESMTEWLSRTIEFFASHSEAQLVVRIHPGELITKGPSVAEVVRNALPGGIPEHIYLVPADAEINTYDLIEIADLGLVYTTTVGLEMAMSGIPVIAIGQTHYRGKGFTLDPDSWEVYFHLLSKAIQPKSEFKLNELQVNKAWEYAYRFFFEYPLAFPWHLLHLWDDINEWPVERVLSQEGQEQFGATFHYLSGEPRSWAK